LGEAWERKRISADLRLLPYDIFGAWGERLRIGVVLTKVPDEADFAALGAVGVEMGSGGRILHGAIHLYEVVCLANLPFVEQIELQHDPNLE
jgi:hypothetical protein